MNTQNSGLPKKELGNDSFDYLKYYKDTWNSKCAEAKLGNSDIKYIDSIILSLNQSRYNSNRNKKYHFRAETLLILLAFLNTVTTALISYTGEFSEQCTILAFVFSALVTSFSAYINLRKPKETWMRHSAYALMLETETFRFCSGTLNYEGLNATEAIQLYKTNTTILQDINYKTFFANMGYVEYYSSLSVNTTPSTPINVITNQSQHNQIEKQ